MKKHASILVENPQRFYGFSVTADCAGNERFSYRRRNHVINQIEFSKYRGIAKRTKVRMD